MDMQAGFRIRPCVHHERSHFVVLRQSSRVKIIQWLLTLFVTQLQKHMLEDKLNDKIMNRPDPEALVKDGVLREDPRTAEQRYEEAIEEEYAKREGGA